MKINSKSLDSNTEFCYNYLMFNESETVMKDAKKAPSKKVLIAEIMATPTKTGGEFNVASLERTNIMNLQLILAELNA